MRVLINIDVPALDAAIAFYQSTIGLKLNRIIDGDVAELVGASSVLYLLKKDGGSAVSSVASTMREYHRHWTPVHLDFVVDDLEAAAKRAILAGAKQESE